MIGSLRGTLLERDPSGKALIEVAGIGYWVTTTPATLTSIGALGETVFTYVHHHVREEAETLFGFATTAERTSFEALISAHGVGPAMALGILSVHSPSRLIQVLASDDISALCLVPGVGKKTAAKLLLELKSKLDIGTIDLTDPVPGSATSVLGDVREGLLGLGYAEEEVREVVMGLPASDDVGDLLKVALQRLASNR